MENVKDVKLVIILEVSYNRRRKGGNNQATK
jgi:hypothetical protein